MDARPKGTEHRRETECASGGLIQRKAVYSVAAGCVFLVAVLVRCYALDARVLWYDECASWRTQSFAVPELIESCKRNVHPPGYFLALKAVTTVLGDSVYVMRGLSVVSSLVTVVFGWLLVARFSPDSPRERALLTAALLAVSPLMVVYAREVRMYAPGTAVVLAGTYFCLRGIDERREWCLWTAALLFAYGCYLHNFLLFHAYAFMLYLVYHAAAAGRLKWLAIAAVPGLLYLPWLPALWGQMGQVEEKYWISPLTVQYLGEQLWQLWCGDLRSAGELEAIAGYGLTAVAITLAFTGGKLGRFCVLQFFAALVCGVVLSVGWTPIMYTRYLTAAFGVLLVGTGATAVLDRKYGPVTWLQSGVLLGFLTLALADLWPYLVWDPGNGLRAAVAHVKQHRKAGDVVIVTGPFAALPWMYYDRDGEVYLFYAGGHDKLPHYLGYALFRPREVLAETDLPTFARWDGIWIVAEAHRGFHYVLEHHVLEGESKTFVADTYPPTREYPMLYVSYYRKSDQHQ